MYHPEVTEAAPGTARLKEDEVLETQEFIGYFAERQGPE